MDSGEEVAAIKDSFLCQAISYGAYKQSNINLIIGETGRYFC